MMGTFNGSLAPDDVQDGMFVAVRGHIEEDDDEEADETGQVALIKREGVPNPVAVPVAQLKQKARGPDLRGEPFLVVSYNHPYLACVHVPDGARIILDYRKLELMKVTRRYVDFLVHEDAYRKRWPGMFDGSGAEVPEQVAESVISDGRMLVDRVMADAGFPEDDEQED